MKAILRTKYGLDNIELMEVDRPTPDKTRGVLIKVYASSINAADRYEAIAPLLVRLIARGGIRKPKDPRLGSDVAGRVEAVDTSVTQFKPGDEVFGVSFGAYAEYSVTRESKIVKMPANCSFEEAAATGIAAFTALQALRDKGGIKTGQKVLVNGAGGGVGTFAVQIAKSFGAEVTATTGPDNLEMVRKLGADHVIDYTQEDFAKNGQSYDIICDIGATHSVGQYKRSLSPGGRCIIVGFKNKLIGRLLYYGIFGRFSREKKIIFFVAKSNQEDFFFLKTLIEAGKLKPVMDRHYPLSETRDAMKYFGEGKTHGKIIVTITKDNRTDIPTLSEKKVIISA